MDHYIIRILQILKICIVRFERTSPTIEKPLFVCAKRIEMNVEAPNLYTNTERELLCFIRVRKFDFRLVIGNWYHNCVVNLVYCVPTNKCNPRKNKRIKEQAK